MVTALQIAGMTLTAVLTAKLLQRYAPEQALLLSILTGCMLTAAAVLMMTPVLNQIDKLLSDAGLNSGQTACIAKAAGICCVTQLAADVCRDAGESAPASAVLLTGRIALILLTLPLFEPLLNVIREVLSCVPSFAS